MSTAAKIEEQQRREREARMAGRGGYAPSGSVAVSGKARSLIEDWKAAREIEDDPLAGDGTHEEGPEHLAPQPAPGYAWDDKGVLRPIDVTGKAKPLVEDMGHTIDDIPLEDVPLWPQGGHARQGIHLMLERRLTTMPVSTTKSFVSPLNYKATHNVLRAVKKANPTWKFTCRVEDGVQKEDPNAKIRVWRVA